MKPTYHHYAALSIATLVFVASGAAYFFIYYSVGDQTVKTLSAENAVATEQQTAARQKGIADSLTTTAADRARIGTFLISSDETVPFIEKIESVGHQSSSTVSLVSISIDSSKIHAHVTVQGSWTNMMRAVHLIESLPYSLSMDNIGISLLGPRIWSAGFDISIPLSHQ